MNLTPRLLCDPSSREAESGRSLQLEGHPAQPSGKAPVSERPCLKTGGWELRCDIRGCPVAFTYTHTQAPMHPCTQHTHTLTCSLTHGRSPSPSVGKEQFGKDEPIRVTGLWGKEGTQKSASCSREETETQRQDGATSAVTSKTSVKRPCHWCDWLPCQFPCHKSYLQPLQPSLWAVGKCQQITLSALSLRHKVSASH